MADFFSKYLNYVRNHEGTKKLHLWSAISIVAATLERRVWFDFGYYKVFPNLYVFLIAPSGLFKKSTTSGIAVDLLREVPGIRIMAERLTAASLISQLHQSGKTFEYDGNRVKQTPVFAYASELVVFLEEVFGSITELLTTFYDCVPNDSSKPWVYSTKKDGEQNIYGPCLNILGASTKAWLKRCIPLSEVEGGFTARVLFIVEDDKPDRLVAIPKIDPQLAQLKESLIDDLIRMASLTGPLKMDEGAERLYTAWYEHHMTYVIPNNQGSKLLGYYARKGNMMLKLAAVKTATEGDSLVVTKEHLVWAGDLLEEVERNMSLAFDEATADDRYSRFFNRVGVFFETNKVSTTETIKKSFAVDPDRGWLSEVIGQMLEQGILKKEKNEDGSSKYFYVREGNLA